MQDVILKLQQIASGKRFIVNGKEYKDGESPLLELSDGDDVKIELIPKLLKEGLTTGIEVGKTYIIKVTRRMTRRPKDKSEFMFMWNEGIPMPFMIMVGTVIRETRGMFYMRCYSKPLHTNMCMRCGRKITHPVSLLYGLGPECGNHAYITPIETEEQFIEAFDTIKANLKSITWNGWILKTEIEHYKEVLDE